MLFSPEIGAFLARNWCFSRQKLVLFSSNIGAFLARNWCFSLPKLVRCSSNVGAFVINFNGFVGGHSHVTMSIMGGGDLHPRQDFFLRETHCLLLPDVELHLRREELDHHLSAAHRLSYALPQGQQGELERTEERGLKSGNQTFFPLFCIFVCLSVCPRRCQQEKVTASVGLSKKVAELNFQ